MRQVSVRASGEYEVYIGRGLLDRVGALAREATAGERAVLVSDSNVWPLYGQAVEERLERAGFSCAHFQIPAGEASKSPEEYLRLLNFLAENRISRSDCLIALGGGVVGDLTGFAAATYLRGIPFLQLPTSLLAAVDSSVGGKTAIDLPAGKNLAGAFYQPRLVVCDPEVLSTLSEEVFRDGCAEVIKYGVLYDGALFHHLAAHGLDFDREQVITRCVELKRDVVEQDEYDRGARQRLNLGHTVGHGVEACSGYTVSHGKAVAIGMAIIARAGAEKGFCSPACRDEILAVLERFGLPTRSPYPARDLFRWALSDKKRRGGHVNLIVPEQIGRCAILSVPVDELEGWIEAGM